MDWCERDEGYEGKEVDGSGWASALLDILPIPKSHLSSSPAGLPV